MFCQPPFIYCVFAFTIICCGTTLILYEILSFIVFNGALGLIQAMGYQRIIDINDKTKAERIKVKEKRIINVAAAITALIECERITWT